MLWRDSTTLCLFKHRCRAKRTLGWCLSSPWRPLAVSWHLQDPVVLLVPLDLWSLDWIGHWVIYMILNDYDKLGVCVPTVPMCLVIGTWIKSLVIWNSRRSFHSYECLHNGKSSEQLWLGGGADALCIEGRSNPWCLQVGLGKIGVDNAEVAGPIFWLDRRQL